MCTSGKEISGVSLHSSILIWRLALEYSYWYFYLEPLGRNATLTEIEGRYPRFLRCYIRYTLQGGVQRYGLEYMLCDSGVMWYLLKICLYGIRVSVYAIGLQAYRVRQKITNIHFNQSADFQSIWYQGDWIPGRGHIRSLMLLVYAQRIHAKSL